MQILNFEQKQNVQYAVPISLRNEQIKLAIARVPGRIQPVPQPRPEPVAVVGFGPSLTDTWERLREFRFIITCSGSHKFLLERGLVPTWHVEVDPRAHKVGLLGPPHPQVEYLVASTCHPAYFDHLAGFNVKLWHVFDATEEGLRMLPPGEWAVTGGCDVGLRAMTLAGFLGFRDLHIFGLDGSCRGDTRHAATHPNTGKGFAQTEYKGVTYLTTPAMLEAARGVLHELKQMPKVRATFYGEGLIQAMARDYQPADTEPAKPISNLVAFAKPELISAGYRDLNTRLHHDQLAYGVGGGRHAPAILELCRKLGTTSVLDYGCGKGYLAKELPFPIWEYDPAVPGKEQSPRPADIVACTDVLEHIEPDRLHYVLKDIQRCVRRVGYLVIHTGSSTKVLADGRNSHLIQKGEGWWRKRLAKFFHLEKKSVISRPPLLHIVVVPKPA